MLRLEIKHLLSAEALSQEVGKNARILASRSLAKDSSLLLPDFCFRNRRSFPWTVVIFTTTGPDKIPVRFVKPVMDIIAGPLTAIINNCNWKLETGPNQSHPKNWPTEAHFRPISVLPAMSKVFEKLVAVQIGNFCEREATLKHAISGWRKGHSTCTVLMGIRDDLLRAMKKGEVTLMVLADFSRAIRYETLITKLSTLGFSRSFLRWLTSYLSQQSHFVQIDDRKWNLADVQFGVPQGSGIYEGFVLFPHPLLIATQWTFCRQNPSWCRVGLSKFVGKTCKNNGPWKG